MNRRICVRGIIWHEGKLLCQQLIHKPDEPAWEPYWCTPGGGVEDGESIHEALRREMIEETGVKPDIGRLLFVQQFYDGEKEQLEFFFHIINAEDYNEIDLSATSHGPIEIDQCEFIDPSSHTVLPAFLQTVDLQQFIESGAPVGIYSELAEATS